MTDCFHSWCTWTTGLLSRSTFEVHRMKFPVHYSFHVLLDFPVFLGKKSSLFFLFCFASCQCSHLRLQMLCHSCILSSVHLQPSVFFVPCQILADVSFTKVFPPICIISQCLVTARFSQTVNFTCHFYMTFVYLHFYSIWSLFGGLFLIIT